MTDAERTLPQRLYDAGSRQPTGTLVHLPWAVDLFQAHNGYIPATAQEALLQAFLGETLASATATLAQQWGDLTTSNPVPPQHRENPRQPVPTTSTNRQQHRQPTNNKHPKPLSKTATASTRLGPAPTAALPGPTQLPPRRPVPRACPRLTQSPTLTPAIGPCRSNKHQYPHNQRTTARSSPSHRLCSLDHHSAEEFLAQPCHTFRSPPPFLRGPLRRALHFSLDQIVQTTAADTAQQDRAWKLWMFLPRMLLHKPPGSAKIPKPELLSRFTAFFQGQWAELMQRSRDNRPQSQQPPAAPQPTREPAADQRAHRAVQLTRLGELPRARQALMADPLAPGTTDTLNQLTDPAARPQQPYEPVPPDLLTW